MVFKHFPHVNRKNGKTYNYINDPTTMDEKCDKGVGSCKEGESCSKYDWCGNSKDHCKVSNGYQSEFGQCNPEKTGKSGKEYGFM